MKLKTTLILIMAVCVVGAGLWLSEHGERAERKALQLGSPLLVWHPDGVVALSIQAGDLRVGLTKQDDQWYLQAPVRARADGGQVERILSVLETLTREEIITPAQRTQRGVGLADYGLAAPWARWTIDDGAQQRELLVGQKAPLGGLLYVKFARSGDVIGTGEALRGLVPASVDVLRDAHVMGGTPERVSRVELHRAGRGFVRLAREDGVWLLRQPVAGRADEGLVRHLLDQLFAMEAVRFVSDGEGAEEGVQAKATAKAGGGGSDPGYSGPATGGDPRLEPYGLAVDEAAARIQVWLDGDLVAYELVVGKSTDTGAETDDGTVYAMRRDVDSIYTIQPTQLEWLVVSEDDLRERDVFGLAPDAVNSIRLRQWDRKLEMAREVTGWNLVDPVRWRADQQAVADLVQGLTQWRTLAFVDGEETNSALAALADPLCVVRLDTGVPTGVLAVGAPGAAPGIATISIAAAEAAAPNWTGDGDALSVGVATDGVDAVYARFASSPEIRRLPVSALQVLGIDPLDPLVFRDRTMLAVPMESVQRLVLEKAGTTQTVVRAGDTWRALGVSNAVAQDVVSDALFFVSNLRALRAEVLNPTNLTVYGLEPGTVVLTLGLSGEAGIQKSIVLGAPVRTDSCYAMVKGHDVVFTLSSVVAELLGRDLWPTP